MAKTLTVDQDEFKAWLDGILLDFKEGKGIAPNEVECEAAEAALERGEPVLLRRGSKLTGFYLLADGDELQIHKGTP